MFFDFEKLLFLEINNLLFFWKNSKKYEFQNIPGENIIGFNTLFI